jgi:hypothetical protein
MNNSNEHATAMFSSPETNSHKWWSMIGFAVQCNNEAASLQEQDGTMENIAGPLDLYRDAIEVVQYVVVKLQTGHPSCRRMLSELQQSTLYWSSEVTSFTRPLLLNCQLGNPETINLDVLSFILAALLYNMSLLLAQNRNRDADAHELFELVTMATAMGQEFPVYTRPLLHPSFALATHFHLAQLSASKGFFQEAIQSFSDCLFWGGASHLLKNDALLAQVWSTMGALLACHGFWEEVELTYSKASEIYLRHELKYVSGTESLAPCHSPAA